MMNEDKETNACRDRHAGLLGMQTQELQHHQEQEEEAGEIGLQEVLSILQNPYTP
jgi:hypothetical protein